MNNNVSNLLRYMLFDVRSWSAVIIGLITVFLVIRNNWSFEEVFTLYVFECLVVVCINYIILFFIPHKVYKENIEHSIQNLLKSPHLSQQEMRAVDVLKRKKENRYGNLIFEFIWFSGMLAILFTIGHIIIPIDISIIQELQFTIGVYVIFYSISSITEFMRHKGSFKHGYGAGGEILLPRMFLIVCALILSIFLPHLLLVVVILKYIIDVYIQGAFSHYEYIHYQKKVTSD